MIEDKKRVDELLKKTKDIPTRMALTRLMEVLVAWKDGKYLESNTDTLALINGEHHAFHSKDS